MDALDAATSFMDDLLDFGSNIGEDDDDAAAADYVLTCEKTKNSLLPSSPFSLLPSPKTLSESFVDEEEEELEWISNKNAFPMVESFVDIIPNHPSIASTDTLSSAANHHSLVSVLETSCGSSGGGRAVVSLSGNFKVPGKARSKQQRKRRRDMVGEQWHSWASSHHDRKAAVKTARHGGGGRASSTIGRKCLHCQAEKTPQWRAGPYGPKTLCNACGVRYKSGRLVPEYRPASSPTFSSELHSNSHRKIMEMRKHKTVPGPEANRPTKEKIVMRIVLIHEKKITSVNSVVKALELALKRQKPLLIVAEDVDSEALATLILNKIRAGLQVCAVKAPGFGETRKANLQDLAILTGGEVITEDLGMNMEKVDVGMLGSCKKVTISKDDTVILDGAGDKKNIDERCEQIRSAIEASTSDYDREKLEERLAKLSGGVAVLKIGGASEAEVGEKKDRVTDALNATKAAVAEGIVPGGGVALLYASRELNKLQTANYDQKIGVQIIQAALKTPVHTIASNAGMEGALIAGKLLEQDDEDLGYDAAKGEYVNMVKAGIIDPLKVIRTALTDAASVASLMTTTEAAVVEAPKDEKDAAPGMGGMGGMDY